MGFLTRRAKLWKYYWKEYWKAEDVIRVLEKKDDKDPDWIAINQIVTDTWGNVKREQTFDDADAYDITFEDSWKSPTVRDKVRKQLSELMANKATQDDPDLSAEMFTYFLQLSDAPQELKSRVKAIAESKRAAAEQAAKAGPPPEPLRLSMAIKGEDLHDPNTIALLGHAKVIPPELAQAMSQTAAQAPGVDPQIAVDAQKAMEENQALKLDAATKSGELSLKDKEINLKAAEAARTLDLKAQELELKRAEMAAKAMEAQAANAPSPTGEDPQIVIATIKAQAEIEKAHIAAQASLQQSERQIETSDEARNTAKAKEDIDVKSKEIAEIAAKSEAAIEEERKAREALAAKVEKQGETLGSAIEKLEKTVKAPKKVAVERDAEGRIIGASVNGGE